MLKQVALQITEEYGKTLDPNPIQQYYDGLTNHSRNDISSKEAVGKALKGVVIE